MNISPEEHLRRAPSGTMIYSRFLADGVWRTGLMIREDAERIRKLGPGPVVKLRTGIFAEGNVLLLPIVAEIRGELYETWFNFHQRGGSADYMADFTGQDLLVILFHDGQSWARKIGITNRLADIFRRLEAEARDNPAWSMTEFDRARERVYARYPSVQALWKALVPPDQAARQRR